MGDDIDFELPQGVRFGRAVCGDLVSAERREWWLANGRGGYAAGTVAGALTRRYHGLLIAPLFPPLGRVLVAAKVDATLMFGAASYPLFSNRWSSGAVAPQGHLNVDGFRLHGRMPVWHYGVRGRVLESCLWMDHGQDSTWVAYRLLAGYAADSAHLDLAVMVNFRGHHEVVDHHDITVRAQPVAVDRMRIELPHGQALNLRASGGRIEPDPVWIDHFYLARERERGLPHVDNHLQIARVRLDLDRPGWVGINLAMDAATVPALEVSRSGFLARERRLLSRAQDSLSPGRKLPDWLAQTVLAADSFVFERPLRDGEPGRSIIAGYPWFGDWGRDTMILATGNPAVARQILATFAAFVDGGMLPNRFPGDGEWPEYNTVDAALWYIEAWRAYVEATGDTATLRQYFPVLQDIIRHYRDGTRHGIRMDRADMLIACGEAGMQLTWMDAKLGDWVVTPRQGKPVEINALWYNALRSMADFARRIGAAADAYTGLAAAVSDSFARFARGAGRGLYDVIDGPRGRDASIRPNQLFAVSLRHSPLAPSTQRDIVNECAGELVCSLGLRSLAPGHADYQGTYRGDLRQRDGAYHQGTVWAWLLGHFVMAEYRLGGDRTLAAQRLEGIVDHLHDAGLGQVSEIFDGDPPHQPRGAPAQAWSVATVIEAWWRTQSDAQAVQTPQNRDE